MAEGVEVYANALFAVAQAVFPRGLRPRTPSSSGSLALARPTGLGEGGAEDG